MKTIKSSVPVVPAPKSAPVTSAMGQNIQGRIVGTKLILEIDLAKDMGPSKSGKMNICATTNGFANVTGTEHKLSLNLCFYPGNNG